MGISRASQRAVQIQDKKQQHRIYGSKIKKKKKSSMRMKITNKEETTSSFRYQDVTRMVLPSFLFILRKLIKLVHIFFLNV